MVPSCQEGVVKVWFMSWMGPGGLWLSFGIERVVYPGRLYPSLLPMGLSFGFEGEERRVGFKEATGAVVVT